MVCPFRLISIRRKGGGGIRAEVGKDNHPKTKCHCNSASVWTRKTLPTLNNTEATLKEKTKELGTSDPLLQKNKALTPLFTGLLKKYLFDHSLLNREGYKDRLGLSPASNWSSRGPPESSAALLCHHTGKNHISELSMIPQKQWGTAEGAGKYLSMFF